MTRFHEIRAWLGHRRLNSCCGSVLSRRTRSFTFFNAEALETRLLLATDFGDAPDFAAGTGPGNYQTVAADGGPSHILTAGLHLGVSVDGDTGLLQNVWANADDVDQALPDDEDGVVDPLNLSGTENTTPRVSLRATNTTGTAAILAGWIDYNRDGVFDNSTERAVSSVPDGASNGVFQLTFPRIPTGVAGKTYARFRISTDVACLDAIGPAADGEVEDYKFSMYAASNGAPPAPEETSLSTVMCALGDLDGDGIDEIAASGGGAVNILFMNGDGSVRDSVPIGDELNGGPPLEKGDGFGKAIVSVGDIDGDGVPDLAVGAPDDDAGAPHTYYGAYSFGAVYLLKLTAQGTASDYTKIASYQNGGPYLRRGTRFGSALASLGDLDGDGIGDLAVGADGSGPFGDYRGSVYVLMLNSDGASRRTQRVYQGSALGDFVGHAMASISDVNHDGIPDLAVGAHGTSSGGLSRGAVYILMMNENGTVQTSRKIASDINGGPTLSNWDYFGISVASLGDLDGDGLTEIAVGAPHDDTGGTDRGAVYLLQLNPDGSAAGYDKIASGTPGAPELSDDQRFGVVAASPGDIDGDGIHDLVVGSARGPTTELRFQPRLLPPVITSPAAVTFSQRPLIAWSPVTGADAYEVWIGNQSTWVNPAYRTIIPETSCTPEVDLGIGRFNLWVRAINESGVGHWTRQYDFSITTPTVLHSPGTQLDTDSPTIEWDALPGATHYELWIDDSLAGISPYIRTESIAGTSWTPASGIPLGRYHAWVRGMAADGTPAAWSNRITFSIRPAPVSLTVVNPTFDRTPTFTWNALLGAARYEVYIADRNLGTYPAFHYQQNISGLVFTMPVEMPDGPYRWWIIGVSHANQRSFWSDAVDIHVGGRTDILEPLGATGDATPTIVWRAVDAARQYELWVERFDGGPPVINEQNLTSTSYTPPTELAPATYRAWVRAISITGELGIWSLPVEFTVTTTDVSPHLSRPLERLRSSIGRLNETQAKDTPRNESSARPTLLLRYAAPGSFPGLRGTGVRPAHLADIAPYRLSLEYNAPARAPLILTFPTSDVSTPESVMENVDRIFLSWAERPIYDF